METRPRSSLAAGFLLIILGLVFLSYQVMPGWWNWLQLEISWPLIVVGVGGFFLIFGLLAGAPGLAVPACIIGGIGGLLYWQNATGNWASWAYAWTLIPGFVGVGVILEGILSGRNLRGALEGGVWTIITSLVLFTIFGSFLGGLNILGPYWPVLLIAAGLLVFLRAFIRR